MTAPANGATAAANPSRDHRVVWYELRPRVLQVRQVRQLTPRMVRVTLHGEELAGFQHGSPADHVKLVFPNPGEKRPVMPGVTATGLVPPPPGTPRPAFRDYTVRGFRRVGHDGPDDLGELVIDFVLHGDGVATTWARQARPGDHLGVLGPRGSILYPLDLDWYLLAGDETALTAIGHLLEMLPASVPTTVIVEVADAAEELPLGTAANLWVTWRHRDGAEPGTSTALEQAIRAFTPPAGDGFAFVAGEAGTLAPIRRYLRDELGLARDRFEVDGYWRRGVVNHDHHAPVEDDVSSKVPSKVSSKAPSKVPSEVPADTTGASAASAAGTAASR